MNHKKKFKLVIFDFDGTINDFFDELYYKSGIFSKEIIGDKLIKKY